MLSIIKDINVKTRTRFLLKGGKIRHDSAWKQYMYVLYVGHGETWAIPGRVYRVSSIRLSGTDHYMHSVVHVLPIKDTRPSNKEAYDNQWLAQIRRANGHHST